MCYNFGADTKSDGELTHLAAVIVTSKKSSLVTIIASTHQWTSAVLMGVTITLRSGRNVWTPQVLNIFNFFLVLPGLFFLGATSLYYTLAHCTYIHL